MTFGPSEHGVKLHSLTFLYVLHERHQELNVKLCLEVRPLHLTLTLYHDIIRIIVLSIAVRGQTPEEKEAGLFQTMNN